jgi:formylglycine-generating enzyme required for sulfatase activity
MSSSSRRFRLSCSPRLAGPPACCRQSTHRSAVRVQELRVVDSRSVKNTSRPKLPNRPAPAIDSKMACYGQKWRGLKTLQNVDYGPPNGYGLYGMAGNIWQWTADWFVPTFNGPPVQEELKLYRVLRGGSWANDEGFLTVNYRNFYPPDFRDLFVGFRVAR